MKSSSWASISGAPSELGVDISGGRGWGGEDRVVVVVGVMLANARREKGLRAKLAKSSRWSSISRAPSEIGVEIGGGR
jgi:hypothetical protein